MNGDISATFSRIKVEERCYLALSDRLPWEPKIKLTSSLFSSFTTNAALTKKKKKEVDVKY